MQRRREICVMGSFKTKARAVELLGRKQIRDSVTALAEIMKNSYDADAELLRVEFLTKEIETPCIVVCDTGIGMDQNDLENKWLVLGTPTKLEEKKKRSKGRALMGEKGIGRLAVSRLGQQMWMFTKKKDTNWNILYINWNIFENTDLYIQDIEIPVKYNKSKKEFPEVIKQLIEVQNKNLKLDSWYTEKNADMSELINHQISHASVDIDLILDFCSIIENDKNQGTCIFSMDLNDNWDRYLDKKINPEEDALANRNYNRLNTFLSDFAPKEEDFSVELFYNNEPLQFSAGFDDQDYEIYDLKIEGTIERGIFKGNIAARNGDDLILKQCNEVLYQGISVTTGISDWRSDDCGKYTIKLCHFEMKRDNSGLTKEEFDTIKERMNRAGGIGVYRDNVRVLPYGEPENDFLELESRRSKSATYYLFSHRNMFGRIDITSSNNPHLEDKSSREGLIENQYYYYFIKTLQNLLITIAVDFLYEKSKNSFKLRGSYIDYNNSEAEKKERANAFEKEQNNLFQEDKKRVQELLKINPKKLNELEYEVINDTTQVKRNCEVHLLSKYKELLTQVSRIAAFQNKMGKKIRQSKKQLRITINERFESKYPLQILNSIDTYNERLDDKIRYLGEYIENECASLKDYLDKNLDKSYHSFNKATGNDFVETLSGLEDYLNKIVEMLKRTSTDTEKNVFRKANLLIDKIKKIEQQININQLKDELKDEIEGNSRSIYGDIKKIEQKIEDIDINNSHNDLQEIRNNLSYCEERIYEMAVKIEEKLESKYEKLDKQLNVILERFEMNDDTLINQLITQNSELKQQNEIYADLANLGMAAEIVNHEFNQLFNNVYDSINQLHYQQLSNDSKYYLRQIDVGFRAISDRMSQLSPMYRSRGLYKKKLNVYEMIDDLYNFFENRLENQGIEFINNVSEKVELKLSLSKIYPILSNLIYNSMYWVADKDNKKILVHFVESEYALYIEDSGSGIPLRNKEKVFEPFFSLKKNGRGLGLSISRNVLESQGHQIEVVVESENKQLSGACFKIIFGEEARV